MPVIDAWTPAQSAEFGRSNLTFGHSLHERPMFDDSGLADILDRYPRDKLGVFTMGDDPVAWRTWRRGVAENLSGSELLQAVQSGRIWLNLRAVNSHTEDYAMLADEIFADVDTNAGVRTFRRDVGLLISSPEVQVFYHLDVPLVTLWQLRGAKTVWLYPPKTPFVDDEQLERIVLKESAEQFAYDPTWDTGAERVELTPGRMVTWPQNAPHRIANGPMMNVSLSIEFMTPAALVRANVIYANGLLRRNVGARPEIQAGYDPRALIKLGVARAAKALGKARPARDPLPPSFALVRGEPGVIAPL